ncbi:MAG: OmpA family protein [Oligoflexia bacterium]|nr:OmpA family protein [Oligoflexia bacterium]
MYSYALSALIVFATSHSLANVVGTDSQNFNTITSGIDFVTVHSSETLEPGIFNFGFYANVAKNSLSYLEGVSTPGTKLEDTLVTSDLNLGIGLLKSWDIGVSLPNFLSSTANNENARSIRVERAGLTEVRLNTKYRLYGNRSGGMALIASTNINLIGNNPYSGENSGPIANFELAGDTTLGRVALGANFGYRMRSPGRKYANFPVEPYGNQYIASVAASYLFPKSDIKLITELFGSLPTTKTNANTDNSQTSGEFLAGVKYDASRAIALHLGAGSRIITGNASPDWRVYAGLNWVFGPFWGKKVIYKAPKIKALYVEEEEEKPFEQPVEEEIPQVVFVPSDVLFAFGSDRTVEEVVDTKNALQDLVDEMNKPPRVLRVVVVGHTDSIGSDKYNLELSQRRAETVRKYLIDKHRMNGAIIQSQGAGESQPVADNGNFQGRRLNRRVEFKIYREVQNKKNKKIESAETTPEDIDAAAAPKTPEKKVQLIKSRPPMLKKKPSRTSR